MTNKDTISSLLLKLEELKTFIATHEEKPEFPASFFEEAFDKIREIHKELHHIEINQLRVANQRIEDLVKEHTMLAEAQPPKVVAEDVPEDKPIENVNLSFNDILEKKNLSDIRKALSLNDRFRFRRDLFGGNEGKMNESIETLNHISSYEESIDYINKNLHWKTDDVAASDFIKMIEKRFL